MHFNFLAMIKALFFDIDGTLVSFSTHTIPASTIAALKAAKSKGIKVFIATGRPKAFIINLQQIEEYIDGYITNNGAYIFCGSEELTSNPITRQDTDALINYARRFDHPVIIMGKHDYGVLNYHKIVKDVFCGGLGILVDFPGRDAEEVLKEDVFQMTMFMPPEEEVKITQLTKRCISGRWSKDFTDITDKDANKGQGLVRISEYFGIKISETMAFGDGGNDIPVIRAAGIGVAMGNAGQDVKDSADYITDDFDHDGIFNALKHFNVI